MDFSVKDIKMGVENVHGGNSVLRRLLQKVSISFLTLFPCRGGTEPLHQQQRPGAAQRNEARSQEETALAHETLRGQSV